MAIKLEGLSAPVEVIRSDRNTLGIQIQSNGTVVARAPRRMPEEQIYGFLRSRSGWIEEHTAKMLRNIKETEALPRFTMDEINEMAEKAMKLIPKRVRYYAPLVGVTYGRITIRNQKSRWGSCSSKGNLNFNCLLVLTPPEVLDSVVVHELCHRKHMDHSKDFYAEVHRVFPDYDRWDKWLKENGPQLIRRMTG